MDLFLEILDGDQKGGRVPLRDGLTIGRRDCDLNIEDSKVSSKHAALQKRPDGSFWLVDTGSANLIRHNGQKVRELALEPGLGFRLGRTNFVVRDAREAARQKSSSWRKKILALSERVIKEAAPQKKRDVFAFRDTVKMKFHRGPQMGLEWTIGYGPRDVGASSVDLPLFEPGLPGKCFLLQPKDADAVLKVHEEARGKIFLNGKAVETAFIRHGDVLEIGNTRIEFSLGN